MVKLRDTLTGFALGVISSLALGCSCWIYFTDLILTDLDSGDRGLGLWGILGLPSLWMAWAAGVAGALGLTSRRFERSSTIALILSVVYFSLFSFVLFVCWSRPMWRIM